MRYGFKVLFVTFFPHCKHKHTENTIKKAKYDTNYSTLSLHSESNVQEVVEET